MPLIANLPIMPLIRRRRPLAIFAADAQELDHEVVGGDEVEVRHGGGPLGALVRGHTDVLDGQAVRVERRQRHSGLLLHLLARPRSR